MKSDLLLTILYILCSYTTGDRIDEERKTIETTCMPWCTNAVNCGHRRCSGCEFTCQGQCNYIPNDTCQTWCKPSSCGLERCSGCVSCQTPPKYRCKLAYFKDVTQQMFSMDSEYFNQWTHSGKPYIHESAPSMIDIDGDNVLDYFNSMHGHPVDTYKNRIELALTKTRRNGNISLKDVSNRIIIEDPIDLGFWDAHGTQIADLDGDGLLDILIASGGNQGKWSWPDSKGEVVSNGNFLFFGETLIDEMGRNVTIFRGGRVKANEAGVHERNGRGRVNFLFDADGDGKIDIFPIQARREDNILTPGILKINQGDRTWKEDSDLSEFASAMILTDVDGDGIAQEILISRGNCWPKRNHPDYDSKYGAFTDEVRVFCSSRPIGTVAIYKFDGIGKSMKEISKQYKNTKPYPWAQPACCPLGGFDFTNDCSAKSIVTGDFDKDLRADHVFLYVRKLVFYFSSDRPMGALPNRNEYIGLEIQLPEYCTANGIRVIDMDNSGTQELFVSCEAYGTFLIYEQGNFKKNWKLKHSCSGSNLGDIGKYGTYKLSQADVQGACEFSKKTKWNAVAKKCTSNPQFATFIQGMTTVDINNDGFVDVVVASNFGYLRFFMNQPSDTLRKNRFIRFRLTGDGKEVNAYAIGATLILHCKNSIDEYMTQFKEISSYHYAPDRGGSEDDRITFGLGVEWIPERLDIRWPNGKLQTVELVGIEQDSPAIPIVIHYKSEHTVSPTATPTEGTATPIEGLPSHSSIPLRHNQTNYINREPLAIPLESSAEFYLQSYETTSNGSNLCLTANSSERWDEASIVECKETRKQKWILDDQNRLRSVRYPDFCLASRKVGIPRPDVRLKLQLCDSVRESWSVDEQDIFSYNGSGIHLGVAHSDDGIEYFPVLQKWTSKETETQKWRIVSAA